MSEISNQKPVYDLEERTYLFAKNFRLILKKIPRTVYNEDDIKQLIRSSGSVGANYIEANESLSKKDFIHRTRIARKEAKESAYWIRLLSESDEHINQKEFANAYKEANELKRILSAILTKSAV